MPRRTLVVGDVHGCVDELKALLKRAGVTADDTVILAGDLVAKGPDSQAVVQLARERGLLAVCGNHDAHLLKARKGKELRKHHAEVAASLKENDWRFLESLPLYYALPKLGALVVHAGLVPGVPLERQESQTLLNLRSFTAAGTPSNRVEAGVPWASRWPGPELVVFGHDAMRGLQRHPHALGLDTGCVYGKQLTGVWLESRELVAVDARKQWSGFEAE